MYVKQQRQRLCSALSTDIAILMKAIWLLAK